MFINIFKKKLKLWELISKKSSNLAKFKIDLTLFKEILSSFVITVRSSVHSNRYILPFWLPTAKISPSSWELIAVSLSKHRRILSNGFSVPSRISYTSNKPSAFMVKNTEHLDLLQHPPVRSTVCWLFIKKRHIFFNIYLYEKIVFTRIIISSTIDERKILIFQKLTDCKIFHDSIIVNDIIVIISKKKKKRIWKIKLILIRDKWT